MRWLAVLLCSVLMLGCGNDPAPIKKDSLASWSPDLDALIAEMEALLQNLNQQKNINRVSSNLAVLYDAKLYQIYLLKLASVSDELRQEFKREQRQWLKKRKRVSAEAADQFRSGSIATFIGNQAFIDETRLRIELLQIQHQ